MIIFKRNITRYSGGGKSSGCAAVLIYGVEFSDDEYKYTTESHHVPLRRGTVDPCIIKLCGTHSRDEPNEIRPHRRLDMH